MKEIILLSPSFLPIPLSVTLLSTARCGVFPLAGNPKHKDSPGKARQNICGYLDTSSRWLSASPHCCLLQWAPKGPEMVAEPIPRPLWMQMRGWTHAVAAVPQGSCPQPAEPSCGEQGGTAREHPYVDRAMLHRCPERRLTKPQHHPKEYENRRFVIVSH